MTRRAALYALLSSLFNNAEELRMHLALEREGGKDLVRDLPGPAVSFAGFVFAAIEALESRGLIDREFFDNLETIRSPRRGEIRTVRAQWLHNTRLDRGELWAERRYELQCACGQGGFGLVWKAVDTHTGTFVALKILLEQHSNDRRLRQRFFRGAAALAELSHPAIVRVRSGVEQEGLRFFYAMDFVDGTSFDRLVGQHPLTELLGYIFQIGDALTHLHARDVFHRDIKPSNILVTKKGQATLIDFDLVTGDAYVPITTRQVGTPVYAAPEAYTREKTTAAYDVYSLARTVEYAIRGREPRAVELHGPDPVATLNTVDAVKEVLRVALRVAAAERTQSVAAFCTDLRNAFQVSKARARLERGVDDAAVEREQQTHSQLGHLDRALAGASEVPASAHNQSAIPAKPDETGAPFIPYARAIITPQRVLSGPRLSTVKSSKVAIPPMSIERRISFIVAAGRLGVIAAAVGLYLSYSTIRIGTSEELLLLLYTLFVAPGPFVLYQALCLLSLKSGSQDYKFPSPADESNVEFAYFVGILVIIWGGFSNFLDWAANMHNYDLPSYPEYHVFGLCLSFSAALLTVISAIPATRYFKDLNAGRRDQSTALKRRSEVKDK